ncbi:MAG TPA: methyltransferase [Patescibacteria group bacterium]|nr:methyltransferase [Patescibacteria group bacterium]
MKPPDNAEPPAHAQVIQMASSFWVSRAVYAAARLGIADLLGDGAKSAQELAGPTGMHAPSLHRLLRALGSLGLFTESPDHKFALTPLGATLKTGAPGAARSTVIALAGHWMWQAWGEFLYSLQTGKSAFEKVWGMPVFDYLAGHPDEAKFFGEAMIGVHGAEPAAVAAAYDFSDIQTLVDVGGGTGNLLTTILLAHPHLKGVLFDLPHVVPHALQNFAAAGTANRCQAVSGSFFESVPPGGDAHMLSHVIHDWDEEKCLTILRNCRKAMGSKGRLLIVEFVLPAGDEPHAGKILDLVMLTVPGGVERSGEEYGALLAKAGLRLTRIVPTESAVSVVESVPA